MNSRDRDLMLGEMHADIKNIKNNVEKMNGSLTKVNERSIRNEVKINRVWKITGGLVIAILGSIISYTIWGLSKIFGR